MAKKLIQLIGLLGMIGLLVAAPVYAISVTDAVYVADIVAANTGTSADYVSATYDANTQALIDGKYVTSDLMNTALQTPGGSDIPYMPGVGTNPWVFFISNINASEQKSYLFYCGGPAMQTGFYYFPASAGMTTSDSASLEPGAIFAIEQKGFIDTTQDGFLAGKLNAIMVFTDGDGNITASIPGPGDFPAVAGVTGGNNEGTTNHTVTPPSGFVGQLVLVFFGADGTPTITFPSGWTQLFSATSAQSKFVGFYRFADGTESTTITVTTSTSVKSAYTSYRINGTVSIPEVSSSGTGTSTQPDPSALTPSWGAKNTLWLACCSYDDGSTSISSYPTNYSSGRNDRYDSPSGVGIGTAVRELNTASENPSYFTLSASEVWIAFTVGVRPAIEATVTDIPSGVCKVITTADGTNFTISVPEELVTDDFSSGLGQWTEDNCTVGNGYWTIVDNKVQVATTVKTYDYCLFITNPLSASDYSISADISTNKGLTSANVRIGFEHNPNISGETGGAYSAGWNESTNKFYIQTSVYDVSYSSADPTFDSSLVHNYELKVIGSTWTLYVDDVSRVTHTSSLNPNYIGLYALGGATDFVGTFDNFLVEEENSDITSQDGASVPDNTSGWSFITNGCVPYLEYQKIWVGGDLRQHITYERDTTFRDQAVDSGTADSGTTTTLVDAALTQADDYWNNTILEIVTTTDGLAPQGEETPITDFTTADDTLYFAALTAAVDTGDTYELRNDATPNFLTTSSDPDVTASLQNFRPIEENECTVGLTEETPEMLTTAPDMPPEFYGAEGGGLDHLPGVSLVNTFLDYGDIPHDFFWIAFIFGLAAVAAVLSYGLLKSMLWCTIIGGVIVLFFSLASGGDPICLWTFFIYAIIAAGVLVSERVFGW